MGTCPSCNARVTEDFGLVECAKCGAQLIVGMDGSVQVAGEEASPSADESAQPADNDAYNEIPEERSFVAEVEAEATQQSQAEGFDLGPGADADLPPPIEDAPAASTSAADAANPEPNFDDNQQLDEAPQVYKSPGAAADSPNLSDIAAFANSEDSGGREGPLRYTLMITGIDTADVRDAFREALTDRKFMWDIEQILRNIRQGNVTIENVPPGKAYILVNRLRNLPLEITWEQYAVTQP